MSNSTETAAQPNVKMTKRELNKAIAEMQGWTNLYWSAYVLWCGKKPHGEEWAAVPDYTGSIEAAWQLIESLAGDGECVIITRPFTDELACTVSVMHSVEIPGRLNSACAGAETAPLAICLAYYQFKTGQRVEIVEEQTNE